MAIVYSPEQRTRIIADCKGKVIESMEFEEGEDDLPSYWVMTFTDGSEVSLRFMAELT